MWKKKKEKKKKEMWLDNHHTIKQHNISFDCKQANQAGNDHTHHDCEKSFIFIIFPWKLHIIILFNNLKLHTNISRQV